ncbi:hypothetical protein SLA2020_376730 [Shorea laevis]
MKYYLYHILSLPQLLYMAEDCNGRIVSYVLAKMEEESNECHGHITSLAVVLRTHRKLGPCYQAHERRPCCHGAGLWSRVCFLHMTKSNKATFNLCIQTLGHNCIRFMMWQLSIMLMVRMHEMRKQLKGKQSHHHQHGGGCRSGKARSSEGTQNQS